MFTLRKPANGTMAQTRARTPRVGPREDAPEIGKPCPPALCTPNGQSVERQRAAARAPSILTRGLSGRSNIDEMAEVECEAQVGNFESTRDELVAATHVH